MNETLRNGITVEMGLGTADQISDELQRMFQVLLGQVKSPVDPTNALALMEVADAFYMRAAELQFKIHRLERQGVIGKGDELYRLRTGELADFQEACKRSIETGSRRLSALQLEHQQAMLGRS